MYRVTWTEESGEYTQRDYLTEERAIQAVVSRIHKHILNSDEKLNFTIEKQ